MGIIEDNKIVTAIAYAKMRRETAAKYCHPFYVERLELLFQILQDSGDDGRFWYPYSALRNFEEQKKLYAQGRTNKDLPVVTNANEGDSPHNWGCATDWGEFNPDFGSDGWSKANWKFFAFCVNAAGLKWGGEFGIVDKPHVELPLVCSWKRIGEIYRKQGLVEAERSLAAFVKNT